MKRKDWKTENLKKDIFGKKIKKSKKVRGKILFLRKLFLRRDKYLTKKNLFVNYIFYKNFLNSYKFKKQNYFFNLNWKIKINNHTILPEFSITKNIFNKKIKFKDLEKKHKVSSFFLANKYVPNSFGLNYYIAELKQKGNITNLFKDLEDDNYHNLIHFKKNTNNLQFELNDLINFNFFFNYNLYNLHVLEIYKIIVILNLSNVCE